MVRSQNIRWMSLLGAGIALAGWGGMRQDTRAEDRHDNVPVWVRLVTPPTDMPVSSTAIYWEPTYAAAKRRAEREGKPLLLLHLFGKLDDALC